MNAIQLASPAPARGKVQDTSASPATPSAVAADSPPAPPVHAKRKRWPLFAALGLVVIAGTATAGHHWYFFGRFIEKTDDAYVGGNITVIAPKVSSFIEQITVEDNQIVHAGDLLVRLDDRDFKAALAKAQAGMDEQDAALVELAASRKLQQAIIAQQDATITAADADIELTQAQQQRLQKLLESSAESRHAFEKADADYKSSAAAGVKARAALEAAKLELGVIDSRVSQVHAAQEKAKADRDLAALNLSYTELRAPVDGVVGNRSAQAGAFAPAGTQLISLVPMKGLWVDANFKESQIAMMQPGMPVEIEADSHSGKTFHGRVASLAPATGAKFSILPPENATGNFTKIVQRVPVRVVLDDAGSNFGDLRPGLSVTARVNVQASRP